MKQSIVLTALVILLVTVAPVGAKPSEKQRILQACVSEFGIAVDPAQNLFEINELFVLQAKFDKRGFLTEFAVKPKYFFDESHPEWQEPLSFPLLTWTDFQSLLARLDRLKPKGTLVKKANNITVVTNSTGYFKEGYRSGLLEWGEVGIGFRGSKENGIRFFTVRYFRHAR